jgi:outer membrane protein OmpA-like peptidoglycan-associated protein
MPRTTVIALLVGAVVALACASPAAAATRYVDDTGANSGTCTNQGAPCLTLQYAVTQATAGDTIDMAAGSYAVGAVIDKAGLVIHGAGTTQTTIGTTAGVARAFDLRGAADGVTIRDLTIAGPYAGAGSITDRTGIHVSNTAGNDVAGLTLRNLAIRGMKYAIDVRHPGTADGWEIDHVDTRINEYGFRTTGSTTDVRIVDSHFDLANFGLYVGAYPVTPRVKGAFSGVTIERTTFDATASKGIYLEQAEDLALEDVSAVTPAGPWPRTDVNPDNGFDINLKYGAYADIDITDTIVSGSTATGIIIKGRNDAPSYSAVPGSLDTVTLDGVTATANGGGGVAFSNAVTHATVRRSRLVGNTGAALTTYAAAGPDSGITATGNWWGCNDGPTTGGTNSCATMTGSAIDADPWLVLSATAAPSAITAGGTTSTITAGLTRDSDGAPSPAPPSTQSVAFATNLGTLSAPSAALSAGTAQTTLTSDPAGGTANVTASLDAAQVTADVEFVLTPANLTPPAVTGTATAGNDLTCGLGSWTGTGLLYAQRWTRDGVDIPGATGSVRRTEPADVGHAVRCVVRAINAIAVGTEAASTPVSVVAPPVRLQPHVETTGAPKAEQRVEVPLASGDQVVLLDGTGHPATVVDHAGKGRYRLAVAPAIATITFEPEGGFAGKAPTVPFRVVDAYGRAALGSFAPTVLTPGSTQEPRPVAPAPTTDRPGKRGTATLRLRLSGPERVVLHGDAAIPVRCAGRALTRCAVTLTATVRGRELVLARGTSTRVAPHGAMSVTARLTALGRARAARLGGVRAVVRATGSGGAGSARARAAVRLLPQAAGVSRAAHFDGFSATLRRADRARLVRLRAHLAGVRSVTCTGFANGRVASAFNARLAAARARAVCAAIAPNGVATHVRAANEGRAPLAAAAEQQNRRVDVSIAY